MKEPKSSLNSLYKKVARDISGQASKKDQERVAEWKKSSPKAEEEFTDLEKIWKKRYFAKEDIELVSQNEVNEQIWNKVFERNESKSFKAINSNYFIKIAAVLIVFISAVFVMVYVTDHCPKIEPQVSSIVKETLKGQKSTITLPDGSIVYLNSGSKISYLSDYNNSLRYIELEGQAFFDVFKDKEKPFIVKCRGLEVEALGTSFDVNSYGVNSIQVSLVTGKVKLQIPEMPEKESFTLSPGQYSIINNEYDITDKGNFDPYEVLAWKEGRLIFKDESLDEIIPKLELWYAVQIDNQTTRLSLKHFNSTFEKENLDNILHNMGLTMGFTHTIQENKVILKNKLPM